MGGGEGSRDRIGVGWRGKEKRIGMKGGSLEMGVGEVEGRGYVPYLSILGRRISILGRRKRGRKEEMEEFGIIIFLLTPPVAAIHRLLASQIEKEETKSRERDPRPISYLSPPPRPGLPQSINSQCH